MSTNNETHKLREAVRTYDKLIKGLRASLCDNDRKVVDLGLSTLQQALPEFTARPQSRAGQNSSNDVPASPEGSSVASQRYLGEASDIRFYKAMKQALYESSGAGDLPHIDAICPVDSYEQEGEVRQASIDDCQAFLPTRATADNYLEIYFSTIHIAYPFVWRPGFMERYDEFWTSESLDRLSSPWLSLLCRLWTARDDQTVDSSVSIYAIGACYEAFSDADPASNPQTKTPHHQQYFEQAIQISQQYEEKRNVDHICALLAQGFYLLATCQTDR